jgi:protoporphyrinogen oxidase
MGKPTVVILGAGPAGLGAACQLARRQLADVIVLEQNLWVGGNAASFVLDGVPVDYGSHRLHPSCDPEILEDIRAMIGSDLLDRPRHGRIFLQERWIHFPLQPQDLLLHTSPAFAFGVAGDMVGKVIGKEASPTSDESFASVLEASLGKTVYRSFYDPYAHKIWGLPADRLSATQAQKRVSANSPAKMLRKVFSAVPGFKKPGSGRFYYPKKGFGQISEAYAEKARDQGVIIRFGSKVSLIDTSEISRLNVVYGSEGRDYEVSADYVWSTIPITVLGKLIRPAPQEEILQAASQIDYRAMILVYLVLEQSQFTPYDAHYFPSAEIPITRLSEPKNYSASTSPEDFTVLCAELPCNPQDVYWSMSDDELGEVVKESLRQAKIPVQSSVMKVVTRRLRNAYPIYLRGYEVHFNRLDAWISQHERLLTFGRQGLFAHDNTHHALYMAYRAVDCLDQDGSFDHDRWREYRKIFESHVVED